MRNPSLRGFGPRNPMRAFRTLPINRTEPVTCKLCGATNLKWRAKGEGWVLVENTRVNHGNYKPEHVCPTSADGFEEVE